eukprot:15252564-Alexandrium_andersonii.AAC.1
MTPTHPAFATNAYTYDERNEFAQRTSLCERSATTLSSLFNDSSSHVDPSAGEPKLWSRSGG